jgi:hypothetical protein
MYASPNSITVIKSRRTRGARHVAFAGETRIAYKILVGKPERKRPVQRYRCRCGDNIRMDLREIGWEVVE